jgi:hypothetical protein
MELFWNALALDNDAWRISDAIQNDVSFFSLASARVCKLRLGFAYAVRMNAF